MQQKNTTATAAPQVDIARVYQSQLDVSMHTLKEAGTFAWAMGSLLQGICARDLHDELLDGMTVDGLACGLRIVGQGLMDESDELHGLLERTGAYPSGGAQ